MRATLVVGSLIVLSAGCATSGYSKANDERLQTSAVNGVIKLPSDGRGQFSSNSCEDVVVKVVAQDGRETLGHPFVRASRGRCSYQVDKLPASTPMTVSVEPSPAWHCANGAAPSISASGPITLREYEGKTTDFTVVCGSAQAAGDSAHTPTESGKL